MDLEKACQDGNAHACNSLRSADQAWLVFAILGIVIIAMAIGYFLEWRDNRKNRR